MKIDVSKLGVIFAEVLYDRLETEINTKISVDEYGIEIATIDDVLEAIRYVLGIKEE